MLLGTDAADAAVEDVGVVHVEERRKAAVVAAGDVAEEEVLAIVAKDDLHRLGVVAVVGFAFQTQGRTDAQFVPNHVGVVILAACKMAVHVEFAVCFHNLVV